MKRIFVLLLLTSCVIFSAGAATINENIIAAAKIYGDFMFRNNATESAFKQLDKIDSPELSGTVRFIRETITTNNKLTNEDFLKLPDDQTLVFIYIIRRVNWNIQDDSPKDNNEIISDLQKQEIPRNELIDNYYDMLFCGIGNKNQPFDLSQVNFIPSDYNLKDDTEQAIFFLTAMDFCGQTIWGYMNIVNPPNYKLALEYISKFPKFNDQPYYQYNDFSFPDFEMVIITDNGKESYKSYYLNKYYDLLLSHLVCLSQKKKDNEARTNLLLGSILKEDQYYKYSKNEDILKSLFSEVKQ